MPAPGVESVVRSPPARIKDPAVVAADCGHSHLGAQGHRAAQPCCVYVPSSYFTWPWAFPRMQSAMGFPPNAICQILRTLRFD